MPTDTPPSPAAAPLRRRRALQTYTAALADLNGDGRPDLIVANRSSNAANPRPSFVCLNDGKGGFPVCDPLARQSATIVVAADLDGDGWLDIVAARSDAPNAIWFNGPARTP